MGVATADDGEGDCDCDCDCDGDGDSDCGCEGESLMEGVMELNRSLQQAAPSHCSGPFFILTTMIMLLLLLLAAVPAESMLPLNIALRSTRLILLLTMNAI